MDNIVQISTLSDTAVRTMQLTHELQLQYTVSLSEKAIQGN